MIYHAMSSLRLLQSSYGVPCAVPSATARDNGAHPTCMIALSLHTMCHTHSHKHMTIAPFPRA